MNPNGIRMLADHGASFVPNAGDETHAPKSLDHYKRGHLERANTREREYYSSRQKHNNNLRGAPSNNHHNTSNNNNNNNSNYHYQSYNNNNNNNNITTRAGAGANNNDFRDPWANRDRVTIVSGMDANRLLDELERLPPAQVGACLEQARLQYPEGFESGKAVTALISASARRRNARLANDVWAWVNAVQMPKNVYHFNAMISVAASERSPQKALAYMREMSELGIPKNEVT
jgi:pentatricopeptide repeat protein